VMSESQSMSLASAPSPTLAVSYVEDDELSFKLQQLEKENLALKRSIEELREYHARLRGEEAAARTRNEQANSARRQSGDAADAAQGRVRELNGQLSAARRTLQQRAAERDRLQAANAATRQDIRWLESAIMSVTAENAALERWLKDARN